MLESLVNFFTNLRNRSKAKRSPFVIAIIALIVIIPTVLAVFYGYFYDETNLLSSNEIKIELYDKNNKLIFSEQTDESNVSSSTSAKTLYNIYTSKTETSDTIPPDISPNFKLHITLSDGTKKYDCYFTEDHKSSFIKDSSKKIYSIPRDTYEKFLLSALSEGAYSQATPPELITGNGEKVYPYEASWYYQRLDKKFIEAKNVFVSDSSDTYKIGGAINLSFEHQPDECNVKIYDAEGNSIYNGSLHEVSFLTVEKGIALNAHITASWKESKDLPFKGTLSYDFKIVVGDRSEFSVSSTEIYPGQFIIISATNVDDISKIIFSSKAKRDISDSKETEQAFNKLYQFVPTFIRDGDLARAIFPFPDGLTEYTFNFTVSYGATQQRFSVDILKSTEGNTHTIASAENSILAATSGAAKKELLSLIKALSPSSQELTPWKDSFATPLEYGFTEGYSYNDTIMCKDSSASFKSEGNEYVTTSPEGKAVPALNVGKVVKIGICDALGNYVVIDHGMGIRTWYCWLSDINVVEGAVVAKGDSIGKTGSDGILSAHGTVILCSVYDIFIDPDFIIGSKIEF